MNILYFASLKESLQCAQEFVDIADGTTVSSLKKQLADKYGAQHFGADILCAVDYEIATDNTPLTNDNKVAFYPPVTGG